MIMQYLFSRIVSEHPIVLLQELMSGVRSDLIRALVLKGEMSVLLGKYRPHDFSFKGDERRKTVFRYEISSSSQI